MLHDMVALFALCCPSRLLMALVAMVVVAAAWRRWKGCRRIRSVASYATFVYALPLGLESYCGD
jgi:hypothetical protein